MSLDISSQKPVFGSCFYSFRLVNAYSINSADRRVHSVPPEALFPNTGVPLLVVGDLNIHNPLADQRRCFSFLEVSSSAPYFELAVLGSFALLNFPGMYTRFPLSGRARPSVIDLTFANPLLLPFVKGWETSLPSTGSDHVPITILLASPSSDPAPSPLRWDHTDWKLLSPIIKNFIVPPPPLCPSPKVLDDWLTRALDRLTALLKHHTPSSCPSHHFKTWWSPHLTILRRQYHKAARTARKQDTTALREMANISRTDYFKAIKVTKNKHWSSFLPSATPQNLWMAKRVASGRAPPGFPSLPGAETPQRMNEALPGHFFPPKGAFSPPPRLRPHNSTPSLTKEKIAQAVSKSFSSSASDPDGIPYLTWKRVNAINPSILLKILSPLVSLGYHPVSLKVANRVVLDKPGKPSYESPSSFRIIVLLRTVSKILERIIAGRLLLAARSRGLIHPNQCGSLPRLSSYDACLTLMNDVKTLQRPRVKVSSLFLDIKAGFDNVDNPTLARILREGGIPHYLVSWVASFLSESSCTLVFQGAPGTPGPVNVGAPQGSPMSPLLCLIYIVPLYFRIP